MGEHMEYARFPVDGICGSVTPKAGAENADLDDTAPWSTGQEVFRQIRLKCVLERRGRNLSAHSRQT